MENSKNKTDNFLKAIKKYADEQRSAMQTEVAQLKEEKLKEATEKADMTAKNISRTNLKNQETDRQVFLQRKFRKVRKNCFSRELK